MEHLFTVAGHTFKLLLPERYPVAEWLAPYIHTMFLNPLASVNFFAL